MFKIVQPTIKQLLEQKLIKVNSTGQMKRVTVNGWIETFRAQKSTSFLQINDGSCKEGLQAVIDSQKFAAVSSRLTTGACVALTGILNHTKERIQQIELAVDDINMYGPADPAVCVNSSTNLIIVRHIPSIKVAFQWITFGYFHICVHVRKLFHAFGESDTDLNDPLMIFLASSNFFKSMRR